MLLNLLGDFFIILLVSTNLCSNSFRRVDLMELMKNIVYIIHFNNDTESMTH